MARPRQPTDLIMLKGKKHLTKAEIKDRKSKEIKAKSDKIKAPNYLNKKEKLEFNSIAKQLKEIEIMSNLDIDALSFFIKTRSEYMKISAEVEKRWPVTLIEKEVKDNEGNLINIEEIFVVDEVYESLVKMQLKVLNACRKCASDLGLSIASRCRLVVPATKEEQKQNKFSKFM